VPGRASAWQPAGSSFLLGNQQVLLALGFFDLVVELAQRFLQALGLGGLLLPGVGEMNGALGVLLLPHERLLGQIVAALAHRQHGAMLPVAGQLLLFFHLRLELPLIRDGDGDFGLRLLQLIAHIEKNLVEHLLRILSLRDRIIYVRPDQSRKLIPDTHFLNYPSWATGIRPDSSCTWLVAAMTRLS
jgi:hypothetical protein